MDYVHSPVLLEEVISNLIDSKSKYFLDCTVGEGGHSFEILTRFSGLSVYGLDRDQDILNISRDRLSIFNNRFKGFNINFSAVSFSAMGLGGDFLFDSALIDLGISSFHYKISNKGFSFSQHEKLDMRLDSESTSVYDIVNNYSEEELADIFFHYAEERASRRIARKIVEERKKSPIEYSDKLAQIIYNSIPIKFHPKRIHPATKCFQALRIASNNELENLRKGIPNILSLLKIGGKLGVITFHSIEDRIVKEAFNLLNKVCICPPKAPICTCNKKQEIEWLEKCIKPSDEEINKNPASRSAKLRVIKKVA